MSEKLREVLTRDRIFGIVCLIIGLVIITAAALLVESGEVATFFDEKIGTLLAPPSQAALYTLGTLCFFAGGWQLYRGFRSTGVLLGAVGFLAVASFLIALTSGKQLNLPGLLQTTLTSATPLTLGALSGVFCERAGVVNIAIEGMMLFGAFAAIAATSLSGSHWIGMLAAILTGGIIAVMHAILSVTYKVDQIISGTVINILAAGATRYLKLRLLSPAGLNSPGPIPNMRIPWLVDLPIVGKFFDNNPTVFIMLFLVVAVTYVMFYTPWGLRTRSVGEHPRAADTVGVDVIRMRYINVIIGGLIAGIGGAYFSLGLGQFEDNMTHGQGFIALAAMIFGNWTPIGSFLAALLFGFADAIQFKMQSVLRVALPPEFLQMAPYILTMIVLAGVIGRATPPAADGQPYEKQ
ncbi:MAG: ABC transporter permease [Chloroflexota bacterium]|nr:ABC transporter permease [Chloroflexota bacterium]